MMSLLFEVEIKSGRIGQYLNLAASLKPELEALGGCLFLDRFKSLTRENLILSYQIWQDEGSLTAWRVHAHHHDVQTLGRDRVFTDYRIRVAQVIYEARPGQPIWQPEQRTTYNDPARRPPTFVLATESENAKLPIASEWRSDTFASVYREGRFAHLIELPDHQSGVAFAPLLLDEPSTEYVRIIEVIRDYSMYDRTEAPQFYPPKSREG
jgi:heme-degrading monooxygenase HmoA